MVAPGGACMVAPGGVCGFCRGGMRGFARGHAWFLPGGCVWFLPGGGHAWFLPGGGACVVFPGAWFFPGGSMRRIQRDTVNERAVRILLECILVVITITVRPDQVNVPCHLIGQDGDGDGLESQWTLLGIPLIFRYLEDIAIEILGSEEFLFGG